MYFFFLNKILLQRSLRNASPLLAFNLSLHSFVVVLVINGKKRISLPPASIVQKLMWDLPQDTMLLRSRGWNSAATTVSTEHLVSVTLQPLSVFCQSQTEILCSFPESRNLQLNFQSFVAERFTIRLELPGVNILGVGRG